MIKEPIDKFHCYGNDEVYNKIYCSADNCRFLTACGIMAGNHVPCKQWELIDNVHHNMTVGEVMELLEINFQISYNACKMSLKRWRKRNGL